MKNADYKRKKHNKKKQLKEREKRKQERKDYIKYMWKYLLILLLVTVFLIYITVRTGNPLLLIVEWYYIYDSLCMRYVFGDKEIKKLIYLPILELVIGIILFITIYINKQDYFLIAISLVACGVINGISYFKWKKRM